MSAKHTPGPWRYVRGNGSPTTGQHMIAGAKPGYLAEVRDCGSGAVEANARLIAAAPDLLSNLSELVEIVDAAIKAGDWKVDGCCDPTLSLDFCRAAIAKAEGGAA